MGEYFANEIVQSCGKGYETEVTKWVKTTHTVHKHMQTHTKKQQKEE